MPAISDSLDFEPTPRMLDAVLDELDSLGSDGGGIVGAPQRRAALAAYRKLAREPGGQFPREWRYDYRRLAFDDLAWYTGNARVPALPQHIPKLAGGEEEDAPALALDNAGGIFHLGAIALVPDVAHGDPRVVVMPLSRAYRTIPERVRAVHGRIVLPDADRFVALSTAFQNCGAYVEIPEDVVLDAPLQLVWSSRPGDPSAVFPHTVVRVGRGARATIVERHIGSLASFIAGTVEIELEANARLDYVAVQRTDESSHVAIRRSARCGAGSAVAWHVADLGGGLVRSIVDAPLASPGSSAACHALYFARGFQNVDFGFRAAHKEDGTVSTAVVRGVLTDRGRARVRTVASVAPKICRADVSFADDTLVLARGASVLAMPASTIATHDAGMRRRTSIGSLDEETLFYIQNRGIARSTAVRMMALAFFEAAIVRFPGDALRDEIRTALDEGLDSIAETFE